MHRFLLATEGPSEDVVGDRLLSFLCPGASVDRKQFPARGISILMGDSPIYARAGHYGCYDAVVIQFDLDDTLSHRQDKHPFYSQRWQDIHKVVHDTLYQLPPEIRQHPLRVVLMAPCQSTDAWLWWGMIGGDGKSVERKHRHDLKAKLYGSPPRRIVDKAKSYVEQLVTRMQSADRSSWPDSLIAFVLALDCAIPPAPLSPPVEK